MALMVKDLKGLMVKDLKSVSADQKKGLEAFNHETPLDCIAQELEIDPLMIPVEYCLEERVTATPEQIVENMPAIPEKLDGHLREHGFRSKHRMPVSMAIDGAQYPLRKRRRVSAAVAAGIAGPASAGEPNEQFALNLGFADAAEQPEQGAQIEDVGPDDDIPAQQLLVVMHSLRKCMEAAIQRDDLPNARTIQAKLLDVKSKLSAFNVCALCFVEKPSPKAILRGPETWYGSKAVPMCSFCGKDAVTPSLDVEHQDMAIESLKIRAANELKLAIDALPASATDKQRTQLGKYAKAMQVKVGHGRGVRWGSKVVGLAILVSVLSRTIERVSCEPSMRTECAALRFSLQALSVR